MKSGFLMTLEELGDKMGDSAQNMGETLNNEKDFKRV